MERIAVIYKKKSLMPMKWRRAKRFIQEGKAKFQYDNKTGIKYLKLLVEPSGFNSQDIILGIDPGSMFDGFSIVSSDTHHENFQLNQPEKYNNSYKGIKSGYKTGSITSNLQVKSGYRRIRRYRLRHRPARYDSRTSSKLAPTIRSQIRFREWLINRILRYYPITKVVMERVRYTYPKRADYKSEAEFQESVKFGRSHFTHVQAGQKQLIYYLKDLGLVVSTRPGYVTYNLRNQIFKDDPKLTQKNEKSFYTHCVDSYVLTSIELDQLPKVNKVVKKFEKMRFIETNNPGGKRRLSFLKTCHSDRKYLTKPVKKNYRPKEGEVVFKSGNRNFLVLNNLGKLSLCKVQVEQKNFKDFNIINNGRAQKSHKYLRDGSTITVPKFNPIFRQGKLTDPKPKEPKDIKLWKKRKLSNSTKVSRYCRFKELQSYLNNKIYKNMTWNFGNCRSVGYRRDNYTLLEYRHQSMEVWN